jgi:hypothetical protein
MDPPDFVCIDEGNAMDIPTNLHLLYVSKADTLA